MNERRAMYENSYTTARDLPIVGFGTFETSWEQAEDGHRLKPEPAKPSTFLWERHQPRQALVAAVAAPTTSRTTSA